MGLIFHFVLYALYLPCCLIGSRWIMYHMYHMGLKKKPYKCTFACFEKQNGWGYTCFETLMMIFNDRFYPRQWWIVDINFYSNQLLSIFIFNISCCLVTPTPLLGEISPLLSSISSLSVFLVRYCRHRRHVLQSIQTMPTIQTMQIMRTM